METPPLWTLCTKIAEGNGLPHPITEFIAFPLAADVAIITYLGTTIAMLDKLIAGILRNAVDGLMR